MHETSLYIKESCKFLKTNVKFYSQSSSQIIIKKLPAGNYLVNSGNKHLGKLYIVLHYTFNTLKLYNVAPATIFSMISQQHW